MKTIYQQAKDTMNDEIARYLALIQASNSFSELKAEHLFEPHTALLFAAGIDAPDNCINNPNLLIAEFQRKIAIPFDVERAVSSGVYNNLRPYLQELYLKAEELTEQFSQFIPETIQSNSFILPVLQNILGYSKSKLKKTVGSVSDSSI